MFTRISHPFLAALVLSVPFVACDEFDDDETLDDEALTDDEVEERLLGGTAAVKPAVGGLPNCTATLVDRRFVLTAAHCIVNTGSYGGSFLHAGDTVNAAGLYVYKGLNPFPNQTGYENDLAIVELAQPAVATPPLRISSAPPQFGAACVMYGRGCQDRTTQQGGGWLQQVDISWGSSANLCPGDSGGPVVCGGSIAAVNSGYTGNGSDIHAHANRAIPILDAARQLGAMVVANKPAATFAQYAATPGARTLSGDFNGDGRTDLALTGAPGWTTLPIGWNMAWSPMSFDVTNKGVGQFAAWAAESAGALVGDFDGDGRDDIALYGNPGWSTIPIAFSQGDGNFTVTNLASANNVAAWIHAPGAKPVVGDVDADGDDDLMITGVPGWNSLPVGLSTRNGKFTAKNEPIGSFAEWAASGARTLAGDFNGDGAADVALVGNPGWSTVPIAYSRLDGKFDVSNHEVANFAEVFAAAGVRFAAGDFDGDGDDDIAAAGGESWTTVAFALSHRGGLRYANLPLASFPAWAAVGGPLLAGNFNDDRRADLALTGVAGWQTIPVALSDRRVPTMQLGAAIADNLQASDPQVTSRYLDEVYVTATSAAPIYVAMVADGSALDTVVRVYDTTDWEQVAYNDDDPKLGTNSRTSFTPVRGRTYVIRATSYAAAATGAYRIVVGSQVIVPGESQVGWLVGDDGSHPGRVGRFTDKAVLVPTTSGNVTIRLKSTAFDAYLEAVSPTNGVVLAANDDCGGGTHDSCITLPVTKDVPVMLRASSYMRATGDYVMTVE